MKTLNQQDKHPSIGKDILFKGVPNQAIRGVNGKQRRELDKEGNEKDNFVMVVSIIAFILMSLWFFATN